MSEMQAYTKKPVAIKAWHFTKENLAKSGLPQELRHRELTPINLVSQYGGEKLWLEIATLESGDQPLIADLGDYIIIGVAGECYPCKPDIFQQTYTKGEQSCTTQSKKAIRFGTLLKRLMGKGGFGG